MKRVRGAPIVLAVLLSGCFLGPGFSECRGQDAVELSLPYDADPAALERAFRDDGWTVNASVAPPGLFGADRAWNASVRLWASAGRSSYGPSASETWNSTAVQLHAASVAKDASAAVVHIEAIEAPLLKTLRAFGTAPPPANASAMPVSSTFASSTPSCIHGD